jgi:hypothetical protein
MLSRSLWQTGYWVVLILAVIWPIYIWGQGIGWESANINLYTAFPLFGLLGYTVFWLQLLNQALADHWEANGIQAKKFDPRTGPIFMATVILHPLLLAIAQFPNSTLDYVARNLQGYIVIAMLSLVIFIITEFAIRLKQGYYIKKYSKPINVVNYITFVLIFFHSTTLGQHLQEGSLRMLWWVYGFTGLVFIGIQLHKFYTSKSASD